MVDIGLLLGLVFVCACVSYLFICLIKVTSDVKAIMNVLSTASPELERRVIGSGTQVVVRDQWIDDEVFDEEERDDVRIS